MTHEPLRRLEAKHRAYLYLRAYGMDSHDTAALLGVSPSTVKNRLTQITGAELPGLSDLPGEATLHRLCYVIGLLDGGVPPSEVRERLLLLVTRARAELGRTGIDRQNGRR